MSFLNPFVNPKQRNNIRFSNYKDSLKKRSNVHRCKVQCIETGEIFDSIVDASAKTGVPQASISRCIIRDVKAKGYSFKKI